VKRPPLIVVFVAVFLIAVGATAGALLSPLRPQVQRYARARIAANREAHGLVGSAEYDAEVISRTVFATEAGLSFFHTHAEGLGPVVLLASTLVATAVRWRWPRRALHTLLAVGALFPLGYLVYALAVLEMGRDAGVELVERNILTPLGSGVIVALFGLALVLVVTRSRRGFHE